MTTYSNYTNYIKTQLNLNPEKWDFKKKQGLSLNFGTS